MARTFAMFPRAPGLFSRWSETRKYFFDGSYR